MPTTAETLETILMDKFSVPRQAIRPEAALSELGLDSLDLIEVLLIDGIKHGHFDFSLTCETGTNGRRLLIVKAGKSHKFSIEGSDVPQ